MDIQTINAKIKRQFPTISAWTPRGGRWKGRCILTGFNLKINGVDCHVFIGKNGLGPQRNHQPSNVPLYCEVALADGGRIAEALGDSFEIVARLLPEYKLKTSYYRYASFAKDELESAGQKLIDVLLMLV